MTTVHSESKIAYGPRVRTEGVPDLFNPREVVPFTSPAAGIDNLGISSVDTFKVPGVGEFTVTFKGYVRVVRSEPTSPDWTLSEVYTNLIEMRMYGVSAELGPILVTLNPDVLSTGQIRTPFEDEAVEQPAKACRMAVGAVFDLPKLGLKLFNKEPITLTIDDVKSIPPAGNPGRGQIYRMLPLFRETDPDGPPAAYLTSLQFAMGTYLSPEDLARLKS